MQTHPTDVNMQQLGNTAQQARLQGRIERYVLTIDKDLKQIIILKLDNF